MVLAWAQGQGQRRDGGPGCAVKGKPAAGPLRGQKQEERSGGRAQWAGAGVCRWSSLGTGRTKSWVPPHGGMGRREANKGDQ